MVHDNVLNINFEEATVLFIYLVPEGMNKLKEQLVAAIDRGVRIVTYGMRLNGFVVLFLPCLSSFFNTRYYSSSGKANLIFALLLESRYY